MFVTLTFAYLAAAAAQPAGVSVPATAQAAPMVQAAPDAKPVKEKKVCTTDFVSGSLMPKRTCRTESEAQAEAREMSRRSVELPTRSGGRN